MNNGVKSLFDEKLWKFLVVGVINTLVGNGLMFLLFNLTPLGYWQSSAISYVLASVMSYFLNRHFTFKFKEKGAKPALRFALNIAVCYLLAYGLAKPLTEVALGSQTAAVRDNVAMLVGMVLFTGLNYLGQRFFAFREQPEGLNRDKRRMGIWGLVSAFALPVLVMFIALAVHGVYPFGDQQALAHDMWHQYYPFFVDFRRKLLDGGSLLYSQTSGLGGSYPALYAYYVASPLNFLSVLIPESWLLEAYTLIMLFKIGFAGLSFAIFLRRTFERRDMTVVPFAVGYALCSYIMGYYWNTMWLDVIMLVPLVTAGAISLLRHKRWRLYVLSLAVSMWCNYYIGLFLCIFQVIVFLGYELVYWDGLEGFFRRLMRMLGCSLLGVGMAAVLLIPAYLGLQNTYSAINQFPEGLALNIASTQTWAGVWEAFRLILSNQLVGTVPTAMTGLPNIYCSVTAIFLAGMYVVNGKFRLRERLGSVLLLLFFAASFIFRQLDYLWHGMHFPNMLPYRFSFLYSFVVLTMGYRVFTRLDSLKLRHGIGGLAAVAVVVACGVLADAELWQILVTALVGLLLMVGLILRQRALLPDKAALAMVVLLVLAECSATAVLGVEEAGTSTRSTYPRDASGVAQVIEQIDRLEADTTDLWRTELTQYQSLNDPALLGYNGVTVFSSTSAKNVSDFTLHLGIASWPASNRYAYMQSSAFTNLLLNVKYLIDRDGNYLDPVYTDLVVQEQPEENASEAEKVSIAAEGVKGYRVNSYLPMGFVMKKEILTYDVNGSRAFPMTVQNTLFTLATGIEEELYQPLYPDQLTCEDNITIPGRQRSNVYYYDAQQMDKDPKVMFTYQITEDTLFCLYLQSKGVNDMDVYVNDSYLCRRNVKVGSLLCLGSYHKGDKITIKFTGTANTRGKVNLQAGRFNHAVFQKGRDVLAESVLQAGVACDGELSGTINVVNRGLFYTSIPYEPGWEATVDGDKVEITPVGGAFVAFPIEAGEHTVRLRFTQPGGVAGLMITGFCLVLFLVLCIVVRSEPKVRKKPVAEMGYEEPDADMEPIETLLSDPGKLTRPLSEIEPLTDGLSGMPELADWLEDGGGSENDSGEGV